MKLRFHNRFIYVGVDISIYALLTADGVNTSLYRLMYCTHVLLSPVVSCVILHYPEHGHVLSGTIILKMMCVHQPYLQG